MSTKVTALTEISTPALSDYFYMVGDPTGTPASYYATGNRVGGLFLPGVTGARLTTESGVGVSTSDRTSQSTLYWTPYVSNRAAIYDGSRWVFVSFPEMAMTLSGLTSDKNYDVFAFRSSATPSSTNTGTDILTFGSATGWNTGAYVTVSATGSGLTKGTTYFYNAASGTTGSLHTTLANALAGSSKVDLTGSVTATLTALSLELSAAWTNDTTRADALTTQDGVAVKSGTTSRLHLGTLRTTSTTATEDSAAKRFLWNRYHPRPRPLQVTESTNTWTYDTATWRQLNNSTSNQVAYVCGDAAWSPVTALALVNGYGTATAGVYSRGYIGIGVNSTSSPSGLVGMGGVGTGSTTSSYDSIVARYSGMSTLGYSYLAVLEQVVQTAGLYTFWGDNGGDGTQSGLQGEIWC